MGDELMADILAKTEAAIGDFKANLEAFALNHREAIRADPDFRAQFHAMCAHIGVDPLASNKSAVNKYLDFKDWSFASFYFELGVSVVEVCMATRSMNGGLIELKQLTEMVTHRRGGAVDKVSPNDVLQVRCTSSARLLSHLQTLCSVDRWCHLSGSWGAAVSIPWIT
jgi:ESCRT-II complex subunit VPS22